MKNDEYWARRFRIMENALSDRAYSYVQNLEHQYDAAITQLETEIRAWYQRFAGNNGLSYADAKKLLTSGELKEFHWTVQEYIRYGKEHAITGAWAKELENASARVHISRLESLKMQLRQHAEALTAERLRVTEKAAELAYTESYHHTAFEVQKGLGVGWTMQEVDTGTLEKILSRPWTVDSQTFRARCWTDKVKLVETVNNELTRMLALGEAPDKAIAAIAKQFDVSKQNAGRVVMTESAYFASAARKDCFEDLGVEQYQVVGTLDRHTCSVCGSLDGKVFDMSEYTVGATAPPFHPWCRCCTAPYFADMEGMGTRIASDAVTGERFNVPANMTYEEWKAKQDALHGSGTVDTMRKMAYNEKADKAQYAEYKGVLGKNAPETFAEFQKIKYSNDWQEFRSYTRAIKSGELSPLADFELYEQISADIDKHIVGNTTQNGLLIKGKSEHFIARTIGSIEQKRNGVSVQEAFSVLASPKKIDTVHENIGGKSQRFIGESAAVTINPDTGILIQVNPLHKKSTKEEIS